MGIFVLLACGKGEVMKSNQTKTSNQLSSSKTATHTLTVYYSNSGTTATAANQIHQLVGGDLLEFKLAPSYPDDYQTLTQVSKEQIDQDVHPAITNLPSLKKYQTILLGFPTWYHQPPMFINTFFEQEDLKGQTVIPFTTSMSSSISESTPFLTKMAAGTDVILEKGFRANDERVTKKYLQKANLLK
ncbi:hypothetical protein FC18_GL000322 [Lacticaseibacillus sharpeae JCM 1186 = DSM 20505]|uniref:Flavodoxin-like domain-containing protein n=2 Tax=Lacticaseibacillus sharpeae TaxID=1626 RepID=A0A0R1ZN17_9LACO|nr:hypothetical protein FC18_GL000322 [Lacticaseibacillus sharpeae JCM 1186 = DSM 20505]